MSLVFSADSLRRPPVNWFDTDGKWALQISLGVASRQELVVNDIAINEKRGSLMFQYVTFNQ